MSRDSQEKAYLNNIRIEEKLRAENYINSLSPSMEEKSKQAVVDLFSDISARIRVVEEYLAQNSIPSDSNLKAGTSSPSESTKSDNHNTRIAISEWEQFSQMGNVQFNAQGLPYRPVFSGASIDKEFQIDRTKAMTLAIDIEFCSSSELLSASKVYVDGVRLKHKIINNGGRLLAYIPKRKGETGGHTHLRIDIPMFKTGQRLALSDMHIVPKLTLFGLLAKPFGSS